MGGKRRTEDLETQIKREDTIKAVAFSLAEELGFALTGRITEILSGDRLSLLLRGWRASEGVEEIRKGYENKLAEGGWFLPPSSESGEEEMPRGYGIAYKPSYKGKGCKAMAAGVGIRCTRKVKFGTPYCPQHQVGEEANLTEEEREEKKQREQREDKKTIRKLIKMMRKVFDNPLTEKEIEKMAAKSAKVESKKSEKGTEEKKPAEKAEKKSGKVAEGKKGKKEAEGKKTAEKGGEKKSKKEGKQIKRKTLFKQMTKEAAGKKDKSLGTHKELVALFAKKFPEKDPKTIETYLAWAKAGLGKIAGAHMIVEDNKGNLKVGKLISKK